MKYSFFLLLSMILMDACVLYPSYKRPAMEMPEKWRVDSDESSTVANEKWWEQFDDPILEDLIQEALNKNYDLRAATARIAEFKAHLGIVSSQLYPQISAQGSYSRQRISQTAPGQVSPFSDLEEGGGILGDLLPNIGKISPYSNDYLALFNASYEVDLWGKIRSATNAAYAEYLGQIEARRTVILTLVSSLAIAYIQLRQYDTQLSISNLTLQSRQQSLDLAILRFKEGLTSELEVKQATSERDQAALQVVQYETIIPQQENLISILIGHPPQNIPRDQSINDWPLPPEIPTGLPADLLEQRPDIMEAEEQLMAANFRIGEARALYFPAISLTGNYGYESAELHELFTNPSRTWQWAANLLQPIFTGWRITNTVDLAKAQKEEALYHYQQTILTALQEVDDALIAHKNSKETVMIETNNVRALQDYLHLATLQYENGLVDYLNVLDAERRLFQAQLSLAQDQANLFLTLVNIYKALAGGWVVDAEAMMNEEGCF